MAGLNAADVLALYEAGQNANRAGRLSLLFQAATGTSDAQACPLGRIDYAVWRLRDETIDAPAQAVTDCQHCGERIEFELPKDEFLEDQPTVDHAHLTYQSNDYTLRMPNLSDLASGVLDPLTLCADAPWQDQQFRTMAETALQQADPALDTSIDCVCAHCHLSTELPFEPSVFFWIELEHIVKRLLSEISKLAAAYGWSEHDILSMSSTRRDWYLQELMR